MSEVFSPLFVDFVHLGLDVGQHGVTVVTPGAQHRHDRPDVSFPTEISNVGLKSVIMFSYRISLPIT